MGQALTPLGSEFGARSAIWAGYLKEAGIAAASNNTVTANTGIGSTLNSSKIYAAVFQDVLSGPADNPIRSFVSAMKDSYDANAVSLGSSITVPADGYGIVGVSGNGGTAFAWTPATYEGTAEEVTDTTGGGTSVSSHVGGATDTVENVSVTPTGSARLALVGITLEPGSTCSATAPSDLAANAVSSTQVDLTWTYDGTNNNYYTLFRDGLQIATNVTTGSYSDNTVAAATTYNYTVQGHNNTDGCDSNDSNTANVTTPSCSESIASSIIWNGTSVANGDFAGASFVTATDVTGLQYQVTEGSGTPPAFPTYTENFAASNNFGSWVVSDTDNTAGVDWLTTNTQTPSGTNTVGPTVDQSGSGYFAYSEGTGGTYPADWYMVSPSIDNATYATTLDFYWNKNHNGRTYCYLYVDASSDDGTTWDNIAIWNPTPANVESADGATWTHQTIDLSGITPTGGQNNIKVRFHLNNGGYECDTGLDTITIDGTARATETTVIPWTSDPISAAGVLTDGNTYNLYARGNDTECGTTYYGDSVASTTADGTATDLHLERLYREPHAVSRCLEQPHYRQRQRHRYPDRRRARRPGRRYRPADPGQRLDLHTASRYLR